VILPPARSHWEEKMIEAGKVFNKEKFIADVRYEFVTTNKHDQVILISQPVYLRIHPAMAISRYFSRGNILTLHMSNGKKQNFFVESLGGKCRATGGPY
jgi:hypothetical protein